jgi:hypothetical protein
MLKDIADSRVQAKFLLLHITLSDQLVLKMPVRPQLTLLK